MSDARLLADTVRGLGPRSGTGWMWIAGEASIVRELRSTAKQLGVPKDLLAASGCWRVQVGDRPLARVRTLRDKAVESLEHRRRKHG